jgi:hypothetical protein
MVGIGISMCKDESAHLLRNLAGLKGRIGGGVPEEILF